MDSQKPPRHDSASKGASEPASDPSPDLRDVMAAAFQGLLVPAAILDVEGTVSVTNAAWRAFGDANGTSNLPAIGESYLDAWRSLGGGSADGDDLRALLDGQRPECERQFPVHGASGERWFIARVNGFTSGGHRGAWVGHIDITRPHHIQEEARKHQALLRGAQALAQIGSWVVDLAAGTRAIDCDGPVHAGWPDGSFPVSRVLEFVHPADRARFHAAWTAALGGAASFDLEHRLVIDDRVEWVHARADVERDPAGRPLRLIGVTQNITSRKRIEEALTGERNRIRILIRTIPDLVWLKDPDGVYLAANPAFERLAGATEATILGRTDYDFFPRALSDFFRRRDQLAIASGQPVTNEEHVVYAADGTPATLETTKTPMFDDEGRLVGVLGIARDVTVVRRTQAALAESERRMQTALDAAQLGTWLVDIVARTFALDERAARHLGCARGVTPADLLARIVPADRERVRQEMLASIASLAPSDFATEYRVLDDDQGERWLEVHGRLTFEGEGASRRPVSGHGTTQDVTGRRRAEMAIRRFMAGSPAVIYALRLDPKGPRFIWDGGNLLAFTGWSEVVPGIEWFRANVHPEDRERVFTPVARDAPPRQSVEYRFRRQDGSYFWVRDERRLLRNDLGEPTEVVGSLVDITERIALEERLRQSQKLEAIGGLAGGLAHDFNNLLTVISGNAEILSGTTTPGSESHELLGEILAAGARAASLTRQLLAFSRAQVLAPRVLSLNAAVLQVETMLRRLIGEDIELSCLLSAHEPFVCVDPGQFDQVLLNLAVNARDAMPRGGRLMLSTERIELDEHYCRLHPDVTPGRYAVLTVGDNGCGMPAAVKARMFEPFYTTKGPGKGTGLGLATVFGIVTQSGGHIDVSSDVGVGTSIRLYFPAAERGQHHALSIGAPSARRGHETILLVEDEEGVRRVGELALTRQGYRVRTASSGATALEVMDSEGATIDLVVTDVVMPEMNGRELVERLRVRWPALRVLFMSGYVDAIVRLKLSGEERWFLQKPFSPSTLVERVRELLDTPVSD